MDRWSRFPPGPVGTSCLTCKRRHKKCDRGKPTCDQCLKGGYKCLGYEHNKPNGFACNSSLLANPARPTGSGPLPKSSSAPSTSSHTIDDLSTSGSFVFEGTEAIPDIYHTADTNGHFGPSSLPYGPLQDFSSPSAYYEPNPTTYDTFSHITTNDQVIGTELLPLRHIANADIVQQPVFPDPPLFAVDSEIPRGVSITPSDVRNIVDYVISHFERVRSTMYFKPQDNPIENTRRVAVWRLSTCALARGGMLIDAKIRDSVLEGSDSGLSNNFARWIGGFEQVIRAQLDQPLSSDELRERLIDSLEIFFAKSVILNAAATYQLLRRFGPNFLQIINCSPTLRSSNHDSSSVSIAHLLASPFYECVNYMFMDIMGSTVYGLPQILDYNTDIGLFHTRLHPVEWVNCLPGEFLILLAKLNVLRDHGTDDWRDIEQRIISWEPRPNFEPKGVESWRLVAWRALQEIWRQALLIYLYLAVCGAPTDDPRIQSSVRQVFQLMGVIRRQDPPVANPHLLAPILIVGICSRTEKRRRLVRERLGFAAETRFWLFRGPDIVPVLDHLWLGAGLGGRPTTWSDYIRSRHTMLSLAS